MKNEFVQIAASSYGVSFFTYKDVQHLTRFEAEDIAEGFYANGQGFTGDNLLVSFNAMLEGVKPELYNIADGCNQYYQW